MSIPPERLPAWTYEGSALEQWEQIGLRRHWPLTSFVQAARIDAERQRTTVDSEYARHQEQHEQAQLGNDIRRLTDRVDELEAALLAERALTRAMVAHRGVLSSWTRSQISLKLRELAEALPLDTDLREEVRLLLWQYLMRNAEEIEREEP